MKKPVLFILIAFVLFLAPNIVLAEDTSCTCQNPQYEAVENAKLYEHVFVGRVTKITKYASKNTVHFKRIQTFKGYQTDEIDVITPIDTDPCSINFVPGNEYLVYGKMDVDGYMHTNYCSQTKLQEDATEDIASLKKASRNAKVSKSVSNATEKALAPANGSPAILGTILFAAAVLILGVGVGVTGVSDKDRKK